MRDAARGAVEVPELVVRRAGTGRQRAERCRVAVDAGYVFFGFDVRTTSRGAISGCAIGRISLFPEAEVTDGAAVEGFEIAALARGTLGVRDAGLAESRRLHGGCGGAGIGVAIANEILATALAAGSVVGAGALDAFVWGCAGIARLSTRIAV